MGTLNLIKSILSGSTELVSLVGSTVIERAVTDILLVSPNGNGLNGLTWQTAYTTIQDALDAASTDESDCTLILVAPHATNYDINRTGDPTWAANVIIAGTHRNWAKVKNEHATATSIMKLTGKATVININFNLGTGGNGLIMTHGGFRVYRSQFVGEDLTGAATALWLDGLSSKHGKVVDCGFLGHITHMTGIKVDEIAYSEFYDLRIHECSVAIQFVGAGANHNNLKNLDIGDCVIGLDIDAGNEQHCDNILFHHNTTNIDDEVGDHHWDNIRGHFLITVEPDNLTGVTVNTHVNANTYGADTEIRAAAASTTPFRIVGIHTEPSAAGWFKIRFSSDSGATFYDVSLFDATKREGMAAPSGTEFIFNRGTRISASAMSDSGNDNVKVWLEIQEI